MVNAIDSAGVASSEHVHSGPAAKKAYTYVSPTLSWFFVHWWKPVYQWICPRAFPDWMHANVVTLLGAVYALASFGILSYYSNYLTDKAAIPGWAFVVSGIFFWCYMTCDNCDGMQARRLGISSPVGELLDHGVDSLVISTAPRVVSFLFLGHTAAERLWWHHHSNTLFQFVFYASHAMSVMNGKVFMGFQWFSVDEMFILHGLFLVTAGVVGFEWMETPIAMPAGSLEWVTATFGITFSKFTAIELFILVVYLFGALSVTYTLINLALDTYFAPGVPRSLALWKLSWSVFLRFGVLAVLSNLSSPYNLVWMLTWTPVYSLMILSVVLRHMKDRPIRWILSLALVSLTRYVWLPILFNTPSFARNLPLGPWKDMMNGLATGLEPVWARWLPASLVDFASRANLDHVTLAPSQGNEGLVALGTMAVSWALFLITVTSLLLRMRRDYHIPALFVVIPKTGEKIVVVESKAGSSAPAHVAAEALEAEESTDSADESVDAEEAEEEEPVVRRRTKAAAARRKSSRPRKSFQ